MGRSHQGKVSPFTDCPRCTTDGSSERDGVVLVASPDGTAALSRRAGGLPTVSDRNKRLRSIVKK